jgi:predicted metal-dependent phosphoesterase TrpH
MPDAPVARVDLHCHTSASFDGVADPAALAARAAERGLTHIAVTDHETIDGALLAAAAAPPGLRVLVGSEVNTPQGDLVFVFLERSLPLGLSAREAIEAGREQGALVGIPHPFDSSRRSLLLESTNEELVGLVDWVEGWNARVTRRAANDKAAALARHAGLPAIGASDSHTLLEIGSAYTTMTGDPSTRAGLLEALKGPLEIVSAGSMTAPGRLARLLHPRTWRAATGP